MKKWYSWGAVVLAIAALFLLIYPTINFNINKHYQYSYIEEYQNINNKEQEFANAIQYNTLLINNYELNDTHMGGKNETEEDIEKSNLVPQSLNYDDKIGQVLTILDIPTIGFEMPVFYGTNEETLSIGPGHISFSTLPIGGINSRCVIAGHSGMRNNEMFDTIRKLKIGDKIYLHTFGNIYCYSVCQIDNMIEPDKLSEIIKPIEGKDLISLFTCTPYGINSHRLIVTAERVPYILNDNSENNFKNNNYYNYIIIIILIIIIIIIL